MSIDQAQAISGHLRVQHGAEHLKWFNGTLEITTPTNCLARESEWQHDVTIWVAGFIACYNALLR